MYYEKVGSNVSINVKEVKEIKSRPFKPAPIVISNLTEKEIREAVN